MGRMAMGLVGLTLLSGGMLPGQATGPGSTSGTPVAPNAGSVSGSKRAEAGLTTDTGQVARSVDDPHFVQTAISGDVSMIDTAKLALSKSSNGVVKQAAQHIVDAHTTMLQQVKDAAKTAGLTYKEEASPMGKQMYTRLQGINGAAFDKAYVQAMVQAHQQDVLLFRGETQNGKVEPVTKVAAAQLPVIRQHLQDLQGVQKQLGH